MRAGNVILVVLCSAAIGVAGVIAWRWRRLPIVVDDDAPPPERVEYALLESFRTLGALAVAALVAGLLVPGLGGRLVMRVLGATSGDKAQGRLTEADEIVGDITLGGTIGFVMFVGLFGGMVCAIGYLLVRRWLPLPAGLAGLIVGVIALGTLGVTDPLAPDNVDFLILRPRWLAIALIVATALLFGVTFTALAARLEVGFPRLQWRVGAIASYLPLVFLMLTPISIVAVAYVAGRMLGRQQLRGVIENRGVQLGGRVVVGVAALVCIVAVGSASVEILDVG